MDKLNLAYHLIQDAVKDQDDLKVYDDWYERLRKDKGATWGKYQELSTAFPHPPTKTSINNKIKVARGLLAAAYIK